MTMSAFVVFLLFLLLIMVFGFVMPFLFLLLFFFYNLLLDLSNLFSCLLNNSFSFFLFFFRSFLQHLDIIHFLLNYLFNHIITRHYFWNNSFLHDSLSQELLISIEIPTVLFILHSSIINHAGALILISSINISKIHCITPFIISSIAIITTVHHDCLSS